jgi:hypothetical protein
VAYHLGSWQYRQTRGRREDDRGQGLTSCEKPTFTCYRCHLLVSQ